MSEEIESYEEMVKKLKPFSVVLTKLSDEEFAKFQIVSDPNLIRDQTIQSIDKNNDNECKSDAEEEEEEIEIEIDLSIMDAMNGSQVIETNGNDSVLKSLLDNDTKLYSCFFCKQTCVGFTKSFIHYQFHIDYFPVQCSLCDEANTDVNSFVSHCKKMHSNLNKVKYIRKVNSNCIDWIQTYLKSQSNQAFKDTPHHYCPACDWIHLKPPDVNNPTNDLKDANALKPIKILRHIHQHIQYKPFECSKCRENGESFRIHVLDNSVRKHLSTHHKELLEDLPGWKFFNKMFSIASLDKFIEHYFSIFGLKVPKKRNKKIKLKAETETNKSNSGINLLKTSTITSQSAQSCDSNKLLPLKVLENSTASILSIKPKAVPVMNGLPLSNQMFANRIENMIHPLLIYTSSNQINRSPLVIESTDMGIVCVDPRIIACNDKDFKYICVFCDEDKYFTSKVEASIHYAIHLNYYPINCLLCENKFIDLSALILHYEKEHQKFHNNLFHFVKEDENIENWINGFLDFQKTHQFLANVSVTFGDYCFVCKKLSKAEGMKIKCHQNNEIREHINQHLHYFPYKCLICFHGQRHVKFSSINHLSVLNHFKKIHQFTNPSYDVSKLIAKTQEILYLEKLIDRNMFPNRQQIVETPIIINLKRKLDQILENGEKQVLSTREISTKLHKPGNRLIKNDIQKPLLKVNGYPKTVTQKLKPIEYIPNKNEYKEPFLLCFHCHTKVLNISDLESHHQSKHPLLTIASYSPNKIDVYTK